jgi:endonuclease-3 related protein
MPRQNSVHTDVQRRLMEIYERLFEHFGDRKWWPAKTREEVVIGAILVQNVAWSNTEKAIRNLEAQNLLSFRRLLEVSPSVIEACIVPTRYYRMKAKKLRAFAEYLRDRYAFDLDRMFNQPAESLRSELLTIHGIGPETADDIVLYAAGLPTFVIDAYTRRIFHRLGLVAENAGYETLRSWFLAHLPEDVALFNQYHALLDALGHHVCRQRHPRCPDCPLKSMCAYAATTASTPGPS